jgi:hypothetical protein
MSQAGGSTDRVAVAAPQFFPFENADRFKIRKNSLNRTLCDSDHCGEIAHTQFGIAIECYKHMGVVRQIGETWLLGFSGGPPGFLDFFMKRD